MSSTPSVPNETFEQRVVFRLARWLPLGLGALATLALAILVIALAYAYSPSFEPKEPDPLPLPAPVKLSAKDVEAGVPAKPAQKEDAPGTTAKSGDAPAEEKPAQPDPRPGRLADEVAKLYKTLTARNVAFMDVKRTECREYWYGNCYGEHEVLVRRGIAGDLFDMLNVYDESGDAPRQTVQVRGTDVELYVRLDAGADHKITVLQELNTLLANVAPAATEKFVRDWIAVRAAREGEQHAEHDKKVEEQYAAFAEKHKSYEDAVMRKKVMRPTVIMGVASALGLLVFCGLILAVLAIERHTRALKAVADQLAAHGNREAN